MKSRKEKLLKHVANKEDAAKAIKLLLDNKPEQYLRYCSGFLTLIFCALFVLMPFCTASAQEQTEKKVLVIPVSKDIEEGLSFFVQRQLRRAESEKYNAAILEINSNGGRVDSAQEIKDALLKSKVTTIAYIKGRALSAAALIAISCHKIYMETGAELGAATPIMLSGSGVKAAEEKYVSAFKAEFRSSAEARKRPTAIAEAMVDKNHDTIEGVSKRGEIVTLTSEIALQHGYCDQIVSSIESVLRLIDLPGAVVDRSQPSWGEVIARYLTNPQISPILFTVGIWSLIAEFFVAGFGILGIVGLVCMALFFGGYMFAYLAGMEAILLFVAGLILLALEAFVIPGFGIAGVLGILAVFGSITVVFGGIYATLFAAAQMIVYSAVFVFLLYKFVPKIKFFDRFVLKGELTAKEGCIAVPVNEFDHLLNLEGITDSQCRPSGKVRIGDQRYDAVSDGEFIEKGVRVVVKKVSGADITVSRLKD